MKDAILYIVLLVISLIGVFYLSRTIKINNKIYSINHYTDTINGHIILSTVCNYSDNISISTLELSNNDTTNIK